MIKIRDSLYLNPQEISCIHVFNHSTGWAASKAVMTNNDEFTMSRQETTHLLTELAINKANMSTLTKEICEDIIAGNGWYKGDRHTSYTKIVTYNNMFDGGLSFAAVTSRDYPNKYEESPACNNVQTYWTAVSGRNKSWREANGN
jgi:hypothetical protein